MKIYRGGISGTTFYIYVKISFFFPLKVYVEDFISV